MTKVSGSTRKVCFFAKVNDPAALRRVEFYAQDIRILEDLGFDVNIATHPREIRRADLYFVWWWTWAFFPVMAASLLRRPSIITGVFNGDTFDSRPLIHRQMIKLAAKRANANIFVSHLEQKQVSNMLFVNNPRYSPLTVDTTAYCPGTQVRDDIILTIAWMHGPNAVRKSIPEVIQAASIIHQTHPGIRFIIAGERGTYYPKVEQLVMDLGASDYIQFPGNISKEMKIDLMQRCKVYLQPSRFEGFGLALLEAMSCGAPVVTSPVGAVPEVAGDAVSFADGTSPQSIATAVNALLQDDIARQHLSKQARARAEELFPYERRKRDLKEFIEQVL